MHRAPFESVGDARRAFPLPPQEAARRTLLDGIVERRGLLTLIGEPGTGKTLLLRALLEDHPPGVRFRQLPQSARDFDDVVERVAREISFAAQGGTREMRLASVTALLALEARGGTNLVFLVDDAETLPSSTLAALPSLVVPRAGGPGSALQLVLAGRPALDDALAAAGCADAVAVRAQLEALDEAALRDFLRAALGDAGGSNIFTEGAVAQLAAVTRGVPRLLGTIAEASLVAAYAARSHTIGAQHVSAAWLSSTEEPASAPFPTLVEDLPEAAPEPAIIVAPEEPPIPIPLAPSPSPEPTVPAATSPTPVPSSLVKRWWPAAAGALTAVMLGVSMDGGMPWRHPAVRPPSAAVQTPEPAPPSAEEALDLLRAYRRAYQARDHGRLAELLAGATTEPANVALVPPDASNVVYLEPTAQVVPRGSLMEVRGPFLVRYRDREGRAREVRGTATWQMARGADGPRIVGLVQRIEGLGS